jgi:hypothetical protein
MTITALAKTGCRYQPPRYLDRLACRVAGGWKHVVDTDDHDLARGDWRSAGAWRCGMPAIGKSQASARPGVLAAYGDRGTLTRTAF